MGILKPSQAPLEFKATSESILADAKDIIAKARLLHTSLIRDISPSSATFENVLLPLAECENELITSFRLLISYKSISTDAGVRDASAKAKSLLDAFTLELTAMNEPLFKLVNAVLESQGLTSLDDESRRFLEKVHHDHTASGLSLPDGSPERERFKRIKARVGDLETEFLKNLAESKSGNDGIWFTREQLDGMPESFLARLDKSKDGQEVETLRVSFNNADYFPILRSAKNAETRKRMFIAGENICAANLPIFHEAILLRDEAARLLGYSNHAEFSTRNKMAQDPETVNKFLGDLREALKGTAANELEQKKSLKRQDVEERGDTYDGRYFLWDDSFYNALLVKKQHAVDQQLLSEYFTLSAIVPAMLDMMQTLFGYRFIEIAGGDRTGKVWHEDVDLYSVWDTDEMGGGFVGYLYLDLFSRQGKPGYACSINLVPGIPGQYPATALLCSFAKPASQQPSLLTHNEVVLLFHELGHCMHDLASKPKYARFHGPEGTAVDFSEAPSQLLEYWFWAPSVLRSISRHYSYLSPDYLQAWRERVGDNQERPPEQLPDETIDSLLASKNTSAVFVNLRQLAIALLDMTVHSASTHESLADINVSSIYNSLRRDICQLEDPTDFGEESDWGHGFTTYPHLMDGYDAGFHSYLYSKVFAADIFYTKFAQDPMNTQEGLRYKKAVLGKGGIQGDLQNLTEYLGRAPKVDAFNQELGF